MSAVLHATPEISSILASTCGSARARAAMERPMSTVLHATPETFGPRVDVR